MKKTSLLFNASKVTLEAGCDEAGRGCLAGPVVAAAVILRNPINGLNDSKKTTPSQRNALKIQIEQEAIAISIAMVSSQQIDEINILNASIKAMHLALDGLEIRPEHILVDGNRFKPYNNIPYECVIRGDGIHQSIAAASILAKIARDETMDILHNKYPVYGWNKNRGYPTSEHTSAIQSHGITQEHRMTFGIVKTMFKPTLFDQN